MAREQRAQAWRMRSEANAEAEAKAAQEAAAKAKVKGNLPRLLSIFEHFTNFRKPLKASQRIRTHPNTFE